MLATTRHNTSFGEAGVEMSAPVTITAGGSADSLGRFETEFRLDDRIFDHARAQVRLMVVSTGIGLESDWYGAQVDGGLHVAPTQRSLAASPSGTAREGVDAALTAEIVLPPSVEFAPTLYYAPGGATTFAATPFARGVGDTWTAPIPASSVTTRGLLWYVEVLDRFGQGLRQHSAVMPGASPSTGRRRSRSGQWPARRPYGTP